MDGAHRAGSRHDRIRLGTSVLCNAYRHPSVLAKMAATLDVISEGRLDLGLGAGWFKREFDAYRLPFTRAGERVSALGEALEVIKIIWTQPNSVYSGKFYTLDGAICDPPPLQKPHPPRGRSGYPADACAEAGPDPLPCDCR